MPTDEKELKDLRKAMKALRDKIENYLDGMNMEEAEDQEKDKKKEKKKEKKDKEEDDG